MEYKLADRLRCNYNGRDFSGPAPDGMVLPTALMLEAAEEIDRVSAERDELTGELGAAILTRDVWRSGHDEIYAELQRAKDDKKELHRRNGILSQERVDLHGDNAKLQSELAELKADRDTLQRRLHHKGIRLTAVRMRAKVDMERLAADNQRYESKLESICQMCEDRKWSVIGSNEILAILERPPASKGDTGRGDK